MGFGSNDLLGDLGRAIGLDLGSSSTPATPPAAATATTAAPAGDATDPSSVAPTDESLLEQLFDVVEDLGQAPNLILTGCSSHTARAVRTGTVTMTVGSEEQRTVEKLYDDWDVVAEKATASEQDVRAAAEHMAMDMQSDLDQYLAITATVETGSDFVRLRIRICEGCADPTAFDVAPRIDAVTTRIRAAAKANGESDADVERRLAGWRAARERFIGAFESDAEWPLVTRTVGNREHALMGAQTALGLFSNTISINPFTWRTPSGQRTLQTDTYTGPAAAAFGAVALLLHEMDHDQGCMLKAPSSACQASSSAFDTAAVETATAEDVDMTLAAHPDVAKRIKALGKPGHRTYLDYDVKTVDPSAAIEPDHHWFLAPTETTLRTGK